ncbi:MAG: TaqI-like C-terminal specificity domain-containing protein [Verrucomicrobiota bacterium]
MKDDTIRQRLADLASGKDHEFLAGAIFAELLNYPVALDPLPRHKWNPDVAALVKEAHVLNSAGDFKIIHCQVERLRRGTQRPIIHEILKHSVPSAYFLTVFSTGDRTAWDFVSPKIQSAKSAPLLRFLPIRNDDRHHTASQILLGTEYRRGMEAIEVQALFDAAFDKEQVTDAFFQDFREAFALLAAELETQNHGMSAETAETLAQELLDRLLFLYFIQKKGWLNGDFDYLPKRFAAFRGQPKDASFYSKFLIRLFQKLSIAPARGFEAQDLGAIPFLNGGLFDFDPTTGGEDIVWYRLKIRNQFFETILDRSKGLFEKYNFTVREDTPLDTTVAVDPEMLGRIFESFVLKMEKGEDLRKKTGSFYTPRVCVHSMSQEALLHYLLGKVRAQWNSEDKVQEWHTKLTTLFQVNAADGVDPEEEGIIQKTLTLEDAKWLRQAVLACRACDPAVGSGAFPIGMLHEMVNLIRIADARIHGANALTRRNYDFDLKRQIIEQCLYGVDIQEKAVRICEVRLWLSLVVDYDIGIEVESASKDELAEAISKIPTLPNLTYHVRCGDSLVEKLFGHPVHLQEVTRHDADIVAAITEAKKQYYDERDLDTKRKIELTVLQHYCQLAERLVERRKKSFAGIQRDFLGENKAERVERERLEAELTEYDRVEKRAKQVDQLIRSALQRKRIPEKEHENIRAQFQGNVVWALDFAEIFAANGGFSITIANPPYISFGLRGNKAAKAEWAEYMRRCYPNSAEYKLSVYAMFMDRGIQLCCQTGVMTYITPDSFLLGRYFSKLRRFILDTSPPRHITMFEEDFWQSGVVGRPTIITVSRPPSKNQFHTSLFRTITDFRNGSGQHYAYPNAYFEKVPYNRFRLFFNSVAMRFVQAIEHQSAPLSQFSRITTGVRSKIGQENISATTKKGSTWKRGIISGGQVTPYTVNWEGHYLNIDPKLLWAGGWDASIVEHPKLMIRQTGDSLIVGLDGQGLYHLNTVHSHAPFDGTLHLTYLCALLNSRLMNRYYHLISLESGRAMAQTDIETLDLLPVREPPKQVLTQIDNLAQNIRRPESRNQIDSLLETLYELPPDLTRYLRQDSLYPD